MWRHTRPVLCLYNSSTEIKLKEKQSQAVNEGKHYTVAYWLNERVHSKKCREGIVLIPSWEKLEWCSAAKKRWWYNEYLKNGLVLSEAKFFNFISSLGRQAALKTFVLPDHPTCSEYYLCQSLKFSLYQFFFCRTCTAIYKAKKITCWGKEKAVEELAPILWKNLILVTWNHLGIQTQQDCSRKREGVLISSLEWNEMSQTNTWPKKLYYCCSDFRIIRKKLWLLMGRTCTLASWCLEF